MPLLASALQRAKKRKAEAGAAKEAAKAAAAATAAVATADCGGSPSSASSSSTSDAAATAASSASAVKAAGGEIGAAAVAVVASSSSSAAALPPPPTTTSLKGSTLSSFDLGVVLGENLFISPVIIRLAFFTFSLARSLSPLTKEREKKKRKKNRHGLVRQSAARPAPRDGAGLRSKISVESPPRTIRTSRSPALGEGRAGGPGRGAGVCEAVRDVPGEFE